MAVPLPPVAKARLGVEILLTYSRVRWWLWRSNLPDTVAALRAGAPPTEQLLPEEQLLVSRRLATAVVRTLAVLPADSRCLMRSLILTSLLARRAIESTLVLGVRGEGEFVAHAWVEHMTVPLLTPGDSDFKRLVEI